MSNVSGTLNGFAMDSLRGEMWVAPAAPVVYRYDSGGKRIAEYLLRDLADRPYGAHDILVVPPRGLLMISSVVSIMTDIPD
jgi:hypothetical protein